MSQGPRVVKMSKKNLRSKISCQCPFNRTETSKGINFAESGYHQLGDSKDMHIVYITVVAKIISRSYYFYFCFATDIFPLKQCDKDMIFMCFWCTAQLLLTPPPSHLALPQIR